MRFNIRTLCPAPSMNETKISFEGEYKDAVKAAQDSWRATRRRTAVESGMTYWHIIDQNGLATDKNINGGVPELEQIN